MKILITDEISPKESIKREIAVRKFLKNFKKIKFPFLIKYDGKHFPQWFLSRYLEGELMGHFYEIYLNDKKLIPLLADFLIWLQRIPQKSLKKLLKRGEAYMWTREFPGYLEMIKSYQKELKNEKAEKNINFQKIYRLFEDEKRIFKKSPPVLAHGDFTLSNFVKPLKKTGLIVVDWEHAHLDNFAYDISHLWIQLWRYPDWQKKLVFEFLKRLPKEKKGKFKKIFRLIIITEALGELCWSIKLCKRKYRAGSIRAAKKTIKSALRGFNNLIK